MSHHFFSSLLQPSEQKIHQLVRINFLTNTFCLTLDKSQRVFSITERKQRENFLPAILKKRKVQTTALETPKSIEDSTANRKKPDFLKPIASSRMENLDSDFTTPLQETAVGDHAAADRDSQTPMAELVASSGVENSDSDLSTPVADLAGGRATVNFPADTEDFGMGADEVETECSEVDQTLRISDLDVISLNEKMEECHRNH